MSDAFDLREKLVRIDQMLVDIDLKREETLRAIAEHDKLRAEHDKFRRETWWFPIVVLISGMTAGGALLAAGATLTKLFG
jgi:hypothetical protein